jgi:hypothetical protein
MKRIEHMVDAVIEIESFAGTKQRHTYEHAFIDLNYR